METMAEHHSSGIFAHYYELEIIWISGIRLYFPPRSAGAFQACYHGGLPALRRPFFTTQGKRE
jgi:hypothetical protein